MMRVLLFVSLLFLSLVSAQTTAANCRYFASGRTNPRTWDLSSLRIASTAYNNSWYTYTASNAWKFWTNVCGGDASNPVVQTWVKTPTGTSNARYAFLAEGAFQQEADGSISALYPTILGENFYINFVCNTAKTVPVISEWTSSPYTDGARAQITAAAACSTPACAGCSFTHGSCDGAYPGTCTCDAGWGGPNCDQAFCSGCDLTHATCEGAFPGTCTCTDGYGGANCDQAPCLSCDASHSTCDIANGYPGVCSCTDGYGGANCDQAPCVGCDLSHATCDIANGYPGVCSCTDGYGGANCDQAPCVGCDLSHATCTGAYPGICSCTNDAEWAGANCDEPQCGNICEHGGSCATPTTCNCPDPSWQGATCTQRICLGGGHLINGVCRRPPLPWGQGAPNPPRPAPNPRRPPIPGGQGPKPNGQGAPNPPRPPIPGGQGPKPQIFQRSQTRKPSF